MTNNPFTRARQILERAEITQLPPGEKRFGQAFDELQKASGQKLSEVDRIACNEMIENARATCWTGEATLDVFAFEDPDMQHRDISILEQDIMPKPSLREMVTRPALWGFDDLIARAPIYTNHGNENGVFAVGSTLSMIWERRLRLEEIAAQEMIGSKWPADAVQ